MNDGSSPVVLSSEAHPSGPSGSRLVDIFCPSLHITQLDPAVALMKTFVPVANSRVRTHTEPFAAGFRPFGQPDDETAGPVGAPSGAEKECVTAGSVESQPSSQP